MLTTGDLETLWSFYSPHSLARCIKDFDTWRADTVASMAGRYSSERRLEVKRDGLHDTPAGEDTHVIKWTAVRDHVNTNTPPDVRELIADITSEWFALAALDGYFGTRTPTDIEKARIRTCERWLTALAWSVFEPKPDPQPSLLDLLEAS